MRALPASDIRYQRRPGLTWIYGARTDLMIALCWLPLFLVGHLLAATSGPAADTRVRWAVAAVLVVSFLHQPLTFALVYGDGKQYRQRRKLFLWAPPITIAMVALAVVLHLWVVIPIAALWNTIHTLQQRYGLSRIYARRAGYGSARLDRWVLYAWMTATVLLVAAQRRTLDLVQRVGLAGVNGAGIRLLTDARPVALVVFAPVAAVALALAVAVVRQEAAVVRDEAAQVRQQAAEVRQQAAEVGQKAAAVTQQATEVRQQAAVVRDEAAEVRQHAAVLRGEPGPVVGPEAVAGPEASRAKWIYQGASLLLIASIAVDPIAGFIAYVGAHAIEYAVVVYKTAESRYGRQRDRSSLLGRVAWSVWGRVAVMAAVAGGALAVASRFHGDAGNVVLFTVGALHFLYDGFIWKLRKPAVAADFAIATG